MPALITPQKIKIEVTTKSSGELKEQTFLVNHKGFEEINDKLIADILDLKLKPNKNLKILYYFWNIQEEK